MHVPCPWHDQSHGSLAICATLRTQYLSRPFVVGDSIEIRTGSGAKVVSGFVDSITPMRTNLRTGAATAIFIYSSLQAFAPALPSPPQ
jgi:hypothetical protein